MKWLLLLLLIIAGFLAVKLYPIVIKEKTCFDTTSQTIDTINFSVPANDTSKSDVCAKRSVALMDLEDCITQATASSNIARYTGSIIEHAVYVLRPLTKSYSTQKNEHNADCSDYPQFQLE